MTKRDGIMVVENSSFDPALQGSYKTNFNYLTIPVLAGILVKKKKKGNCILDYTGFY
jgi:hypothetical protein